MSTELLAIMGALIVLCLVPVLYLFYRKRHKVSTAIGQHDLIEVSPLENKANEVECDLALLDESGAKIIESREIHQIPARAYKISSSDGALHRVRHLASDLFKGASSISNKTVEVVFNQDIQKGLAEGTYTLMKTKSGEVLADAVDSSGAIVGKGRLIQGGKARQLASGAFQLVSIAVAQSHLADIERSLGAIEDSISEVLARQENEDKAKITGAFDYLKEIALYMKMRRSPEEVSQLKRNVIEGIIRDSYAWRNKLEEDVSSLIDQIYNLKDLDTFGTGATYERLKELVGKIDPLIKRHKLLLNLASATNFVTAYLDPAQSQFTKIKPESENWAALIEEFKSVAIERSSRSLSKAFFNSDETLYLRNNNIKALSSNYLQVAIDQQKEYESLTSVLEKSMENLVGCDGKVRIAMSFDEHGEVKDAAIV